MSVQTRITWTFIYYTNTPSLNEPEFIDVGVNRFKPRLQNTFLIDNQILAIWEPGLSIGNTPSYQADQVLSNVIRFRKLGTLDAANYYQEMSDAIRKEYNFNYKGM